MEEGSVDTAHSSERRVECARQRKEGGGAVSDFNKLIYCPFCGQVEKFSVVSGWKPNNLTESERMARYSEFRVRGVRCDKCLATGPMVKIPSDLNAAWNTRPADPVKEKLAEALRAAEEELRLIRMKDSNAVYDPLLRTATIPIALAAYEKERQ